jgi:predicted Zn-dependent peptidase
MLGDATGSRLYYALVDPAIADEAAVHYDPLDGAGGYITFITGEAGRADRAVRIAHEEFRRFMDDGPTEEELEAAKNKIASGATLKGELPMGRLGAVGTDWVYRREYVPLAAEIERLFSVTAEETVALARENDLCATTMVALGPREEL